jgi:hypothetical protein
MIWHSVDIVAGRFGQRQSPRRKPPIIEFISIELKLSNVAEAICQARHNLSQSHRSFVAMPEERFERMLFSTRKKFMDAGVGLLSVGEDVVEVVKSSNGRSPDARFVAKLWNRTRKGFAG